VYYTYHKLLKGEIMSEKQYYDDRVQITCTPQQRDMFKKIATVRHSGNEAQAGREAIAEYIIRHREEVK